VQDEVISLGVLDLGLIAVPNKVISLGDPDSGQIALPDDAILLGEPDSGQIAVSDDAILLDVPDSGEIAAKTIKFNAISLTGTVEILVNNSTLWYSLIESCGRTVAKITLLRFFFRKLIEQMFLKCLANAWKHGMIKLLNKIRMWVCVGSSRRIRHGFTPD
jgi:hypothetical protein